MASFSIVLQPSVRKDLRFLSAGVVDRVWVRIEGLGEDPLPRQSVKLSGASQFYRLRVGDYRIIYELDTHGRTITIHRVRHRRDVYRKT